MINKNKTLDLLDYITKPMTRESITIIYTANGIRYEKCELFNDFVQSLLMLMFDTYLGDEVTNSQAQKSHFKWCWETNINNFKAEKIIIGNYKCFNYFLNFMQDVYYTNTLKTDKEFTNNIMKMWSFLLNYDSIKSKSDVDTFLEVYKMLDNSIFLN